MGLLLSGAEPFIPDVWLTFKDDDTGEVTRCNNRDVPTKGPKGSKQIKAELTLATAGEKSEYLDRVNETDIHTQKITVKDVLNFNKACAEKCHYLEGLEDFGIKTGADLVKHAARAELNEIIVEIFHKVCGTHTDDIGKYPDEEK